MGFDPPLSVAEVMTAFPSLNRIAHLAGGGQGVVFSAHVSDSPSKKIALKIYFPGSVLERTLREISALEKISDPSVVRLHEAGLRVVRGQECQYVAMDFIEGTCLLDDVKKGPLSERDVAKVGETIAKAIKELWKGRIVHRDIKPENIMRRTSGHSILIDLGVARHLSCETLTACGKTWGTLGYMSPEHARATKQLTCKSDIFSLGITLQECLLGKHPTSGNQHTLTFGGIPTTTLAPTVSPDLAGIIDRMVASRAELRPMPERIIDEFQEFPFRL